MKIKRIALVLLVVALSGCAALYTQYAACVRVTPVPLKDLPATHAPGSLDGAECIGSYSLPASRALLWYAGLSKEVAISDGAKLYRVRYWTVDTHGVETIASGLVAIPKKLKPRGVVSYQHGTRTQRAFGPSRPSLDEGVLIAAVFAGGNYLVTAPDYIGFGASTLPHPYVHAATEASATVDLLKAAEQLSKHLGVNWAPSVYLLGFSQGGHATAAAHRALEKEDDPRFQVAASAPISGVYDLAGITFPHTLEGKSTASSMYLAFLFNAYSSAYDKPLSDIVVPSYCKPIPMLFDGNHTEDEVMNSLPAKPRKMLTAEFAEAYDKGQPHWLMTALRENGVINWTPKAPVRAYYGEEDIDVSPQEALTLAAAGAKAGANIQAVSTGACDHTGSVYRAVPQVRAWFDQISSRPAQPGS
ncbi:MAG: lipase family protein [FCB group bacterium]|jgi:pimeloyl-ACP methyl ester carboxylesterase|nr:lipase family protein [FCB group bacterium]